MVVYGGALLSVSELLELGITGSKSLPRVEAFSVLLCKSGQVLVAENLAAVASLLLLDISEVGPASDAQATEEES